MMRRRPKLRRPLRSFRLEKLEQRTMLASSATYAVEILPVEVADATFYRMNDFDGDGLLDVGVINRRGFSWFAQTNDAREFQHRQTFGVGATYFDLADLDGDHLSDLVLGTASAGLRWYRNHGMGGFEVASHHLAAVPDAGEFAAADVDQDGDADVLIPLADGSVLHMENADGLGNFRLKEQIDGMSMELPEIRVADIDNDLALDLIIASTNGLAWHRNVDGHFAEPGSEISSDAASSPQLADIDDDIDVDIVMRRATAEGGELVWLENDGARFDQAHLIYAEHVDEEISDVFAGDIDHDRDVDIIASQSSRGLTAQTLVVYSNTDGNGTFRADALSGSDVHLIGLDETNGDAYLDIMAIRSNGQLATYDFRVIGDVDRSGTFDSSDLVVVLQHGQYEDEAEYNSTFREGDWDGDRDFTTSDLVFAFQAGTYERLSYPRLLFTKEDIPAMRAKLLDPYRKSQLDREISVALNTIDTDYSDPTLFESHKARDGQRYAFLALILEPHDPLRDRFAEKGLEVLANANEGRWQAAGRFPERQATFDLSEALHQWHTSGVLFDLSLAYDWLVGTGDLRGVARQDARFRILRLAQMEHNQQSTPYDEWDFGRYPIRVANYMFRSLSGVGFAALTFPDQRGLITDPYNRLAPEHRSDFNTSQTLRWVLGELFEEISVASKTVPSWRAHGQSHVEHHITPDGVIRESFYYQLDTFSLLIPFLVALDRCNGEDYLSSDGPTDGRILEAFTTNFKAMLPDGSRPLIGDAFAGDFYFWQELIAARTDTPGAHYSGTRTPNFGISLAYYVDSIPRVQPEFRTEFLPDSGLAIFRDQWGPDATYLLLVAQDDAVLGHDQADQASILLYAHGTPLVIEPGYGAAYSKAPDARRGGKDDWINSALGHSTMTIDSLYTVDTTPHAALWQDAVTPSVRWSYTEVPDPATIENTLAAREIDYAEAHVTYTSKQAQLVRAVVFPRHRYFLLEDSMLADESHQYGWQLHLGNSDSGRFTGSQGDYVWTIPSSSHNKEVSLGILMLDDQARNVNVYDNGPTNRTGYRYPQHVYDHTYILADKEAEDVTFVTLLDPYEDEADKLDVETLIEGRVWKVVHSATAYDLILSQTDATEMQFGEIRTDARFLVASVDIVGGREELISVLARGGTVLDIGYDTQQTFQISDGPLFHFEAPE